MKFEAGKHKTVEILNTGDRPQILLRQRLGHGHIEVVNIDGVEDLEAAIEGLQQARETLKSPGQF
ncbi:hypothetical protein [Leptolyngbya sp. FACHB-16]|uniref:hypothetical protein n=1 Tax=unclassified Leptolyngbya TaxID=2650499 RepID=UPI001688DB63|nr:hypothetical protein [Leptolyngbya sp. FACHB-16]MBD2153156.1 hypothetical protein [Leptolyngbya sp. FACHB-16]